MEIKDNILKEVRENDIKNGKFYVAESITCIDNKAFQYCTNLDEIYIPESVKTIGNDVFQYCRNLKNIQLPEGITSIGSSAFYDCRELTNIILPKGLTKINNNMFNNCINLKNIIIPEGVTIIDNGVFSFCRNLKQIQIPKSVKTIGKSAFYVCTNLEDVEISEGITNIAENTFNYCINLKNIQLPNGITNIAYGAFYGCESLQYINLPESLESICDNAFQACKNLIEIKLPENMVSLGNNVFYDCNSLKQIQIPNKIKSIGNFSFYGCQNLENIELPKGLLYIGNNAFENCSKLNEIKIPEGVVTISSGAFKYCRNLSEIILPESVTNIGSNAFRFCISLKQIQLPENIKNIGNNIFEECKCLDKIIRIINNEKLIINLTNIIGKNLNIADKEDFYICSKLSEKLNKNNIKFHDIFINSLLENENTREICKDIDFKTFKSNIPNINNLLYKQTEEEQIDFYKFAMVLGCFNSEKIIDEKGNKLSTSVSQKACTLLAQLLKTKQMQIGNYHKLFNTLQLNTQASLEIIKFLSPTGNGENRKFENLEMLCKLEESNSGAFVKFITNFEKIKEYKTIINEKGIPKIISWEEAFQNFVNDNTYIGITDENKDIAKIFASKGIKQEIFDKAVELRKQAEEDNIPEHILGKCIKEETSLYKPFTYEWLSKKDPRNFIMGAYCSCCGTIESMFFGKNIAKASVIAKNVQNIVIKDINENIIAKGTMYVDKEKGFGVINDFEINSKYKKHEQRSGIYKTSEDSKEEQERQLIFNAFMSGIEKFVQEYDLQYPDNPIKQINVGLGYNRLKRQVEQIYKQYKESKEIIPIIEVPGTYSFNDAQTSQRVLYKRKSVKDIFNKDENER